MKMKPQSSFLTGTSLYLELCTGKKEIESKVQVSKMLVLETFSKHRKWSSKYSGCWHQSRQQLTKMIRDMTVYPRFIIDNHWLINNASNQKPFEQIQSSFTGWTLTDNVAFVYTQLRLIRHPKNPNFLCKLTEVPN